MNNETATGNSVSEKGLSAAQAKNLAIAGAEYLGLEYDHFDDKVYLEFVDLDDSQNKIFDPANDANDRDKLIEALGIYADPNQGRWYCGQITYDGLGENVNTTEDKDRTEAILRCLCKCLDGGTCKQRIEDGKNE